ncbi:hypothetical protein J3E64_000353 [Sphingobium sp. OAS761]|uniref:hypothetical protein n=1 Tax=Sphingobium sp. OAS761 TaxID=2817901 RepID=UPI00209F85A7|nr:hypothetical protein [Sphingobium sp. OAS761]MCP1468686.1 hypothetical protein [Sphingobium sp. OAS761]
MGAEGSNPVALRRAAAARWTQGEERLFLDGLAATLDSDEAARLSGRSRASAYARRRNDPDFARAWDRAIGTGYVELEAALLRDMLFGHDVEEITLDASGAVTGRKVKRGRDHRAALAMLDKWRDHMATTRDGGDAGPDTDSAVARVRAMLDEIRRKRADAGG